MTHAICAPASHIFQGFQGIVVDNPMCSPSPPRSVVCIVALWSMLFAFRPWGGVPAGAIRALL